MIFGLSDCIVRFVNRKTFEMNAVLKYCIVISLLCEFPQILFSATPAKYAGEFIAIGVGGRALGLGGAYAALANDVTAGYWNPAGLSDLAYPQFILMHDEE